MLLNGPDGPNEDTLYFISEQDSLKAKLYLGNKLIAGGEGSGGDFSLNDLSNVLLSTSLKDKTILTYNKNSGLWVDTDINSIISIFSGSTQNSAGEAGLVPVAPLGKTNLFLRSDGSWVSIDSAANDSAILTIENENSSRLHLDIINDATEDILLANGDIIIIKDIIAGDKWQYTSYVYNGSTWAAMDGNYNAENIYFDEDFIFTEKIGTIKTIPSSGSLSVKATGKNLREFLAEIFAEEKKPTIINPSISFNLPEASSYEVGTTISPYYDLSFNKGSYSYDMDSGVKTLEWVIEDNNNNTKDKQFGSFPEIQIKDNSYYQISAQARYSDGIIPKNNLGNLCSDKQIKAGMTNKIYSEKISGYRNIFGGLSASNDLIDSNFIRNNLQFFGDSNINKEITWKAENLLGCKRYILAIPKNNKKTFVSATILSSMNADSTADYIKQEDSVLVEGAQGYDAIEYDIWIYEPATIVSNEIHKIIIQ